MSRAGAIVRAGATAAGLLLLLTACEDEPRVDRPIVRHADVQAELSYARGQGPVLLVVKGEAFPIADEVVRGATLQAVQGGPPGMGVTFTLDPGEAGQTERRLVIGFNTPAEVRGGELCAVGEEIPGEPHDDGTVELVAAFCNGGTALSEITGRAPTLRDASDPDFRELVRVAMRELFPQAER